MDSDSRHSWRESVLAAWRAGQRLSAVGPGPVEAHFDHALALAAQLEPPGVGVDLGSGAGIPGLVLAGVWPSSRWLLLDAAARRTALLKRAVRELGWADRVEVRHGRAEEVAWEPSWREAVDLVISRSFGSPAATAECGAGFLRPSGVLVVTEPPLDDPTSDRWPPDGLARLGLATVPSRATDQVRVQRLVRVGALPDDTPRRPGVPQRRPVF